MERTVLITISLCKTAHLGRIASHYEFAPHRPESIDRPLPCRRKRVDNDAGNYLAELHSVLLVGSRTYIAHVLL
jgi:hypothetical protein